MSNLIPIWKYIEDALQTNQLAVLATVSEDQPHASLIAFTPFEGFHQLIFATYRNTHKFRNLAVNGKVAVLIEGKNEEKSGIQNGFVITAYGVADEISLEATNIALQAHLQKYPELLSFTSEPDCALILVKVENYQVVQGIDNVVWCTVDDLDKSKNGMK
ncbi:MAG: pyridoxamine 5'-phosphate oxidase family protein [Bacteroidales bacterium]|nr:pyridoxamine 5'-phosphate oxidase family protein [Bacteroidales bacterium]